MPAAIRGWLTATVLLILLICGFSPAAAQAPGSLNHSSAPLQLAALNSARTEDGVKLSFHVLIHPPQAIEDALLKGVPIYFLAEAKLLRPRWYWTDQRVAQASRSWRLAWQPLTRTWRVSFGVLQQRYDSLPEAMAAISRVSNWKIAEPLASDDDHDYVIEFSYRLDNSQLPKPLQLGLGSPSEWDMAVKRTIRLSHSGTR